MARKTAVANVNWPIIFAMVKDAVAKILQMIVAGIAAGGTTGYMIQREIDAIKPNIPPGLFKKILPPPNKAEEAIGRITFGKSGCTATVIGPIFDDDRQIAALTAAHCVALGQRGKMTLKDGRTFDVVCVARDASSDCAWLTAARPEGYIPYLLLADDPPPPGSKVWHQGYGIDRPANREWGSFTATAPTRNQLRYRLSVSPGDSGGGIVCDATGKVLSPVCCTTRLSGTGDVWGASPAACSAIRPRVTSDAIERTAVNPILRLQVEEAEQWY